MSRRTYNPDYHRTFVEQHHLRPDDVATRTTPVFSREAMGFPVRTSKCRVALLARAPRRSESCLIMSSMLMVKV